MGIITSTLQPVVNLAWRMTRTQKQPPVRKWKPAKRSFQAGVMSRLNQDWSTTPINIDQIVWQELRNLRARSREQFRSNDYARRFIQLLKSNVIGDSGIRLQSQVIDFNGKADQPARQAIERAWLQWQKAKSCDYKHQLPFIDLLNLIMATLPADGEVFIRKREAGPFLYQLELIDAELIDVQLNETKENGSYIRFGIEYDSSNRAVAYHVTSTEENRFSWFSPYTSGHYVRIPAVEITHLYIVEHIGQRRGIPWMSTPLQRMKMLSAMEDAALIAARIGASKMGFFRSDSGDEYEGEEDESGTPVMDVNPGTFENIGSLQFEQFDPDYPKGEFATFVKNILRGVSAGLGVSYNTLANDLEGVNFSSMRHGVMEDREGYKAIQAWIIRAWLDDLFTDWIESQHLLGTIAVPGRKGNTKALSRPLDYYRPARFQPRRWPWVDILKEVQTKKMELELGLTSVSRIIRELGHDPDEVFAEIAAERELLEEMGITPAIFKIEAESNVEQDNATEEDEQGTAPKDHNGNTKPDADD